MGGNSTTHQDSIERALQAAAARYVGARRHFRWYAFLKYRMDPCYREIGQRVGRDSFTVDLGTGLGMLPVFLGMLGERRRVLGIEWDPERIRCGLHASRGLSGVEMVQGDLHTSPIPACDVITLIDVLHYYEADQQEALLKRCREALKPGGRLLLREGDGDRTGGARWTRVVENWATRLGWNRGPMVRFRPISELRTTLVRLGFHVTEGELASWFLPGNVLLVAEVEERSQDPKGGPRRS
jgi:SAM-dependent methyltransferase